MQDLGIPPSIMHSTLELFCRSSATAVRPSPADDEGQRLADGGAHPHQGAAQGHPEDGAPRHRKQRAREHDGHSRNVRHLCITGVHLSPKLTARSAAIVVQLWLKGALRSNLS